MSNQKFMRVSSRSIAIENAQKHINALKGFINEQNSIRDEKRVS
jgi:hypothetical protein